MPNNQILSAFNKGKRADFIKSVKESLFRKVNDKVEAVKRGIFEEFEVSEEGKSYRKSIIDSIMSESYEIYHPQFSSAVQHAMKQAEKRGYEVDEDEWFNKVSSGPKKPSEGKTNKYTIELSKGGKLQKKSLHMQVYNRGGSKPYELNMYIESADPCWKGYEQIGNKKKDGKEVPNCVPVKESSQMDSAVETALELWDEYGYNKLDKAIADAAKKHKVAPKELKTHVEKKVK